MNRFKLLCAVLIVAVAGTGCDLKSKSPAQADIDRGVEALKARDLDLAAACFDAALRIEPTNVEALSRRAHTYVAQDDDEAAIRLSSEAIRVDPAYWRAYVARGEAYRRGDEAKAIADLTKAIALRPDLPDAYFARGRCYGQGRFGTEKRKKALGDFTKAIELNPGSGSAYYFRGSVLEENNQPAAALADFEKAIECGGLTDFWATRAKEGVASAKEAVAKPRLLAKYRANIKSLMAEGRIEAAAILSLKWQEMSGERESEYEFEPLLKMKAKEDRALRTSTAPLYLEKGREFLRAGDFQSAKAAYESCIALDSSFNTTCTRELDEYKRDGTVPPETKK